MYLIVGLGNPEAEYARTRHNMGVDVVNELADKYKIAISREKFEGLYGTGEIENEKVIKGGPGTHNGMKSVVSRLNSEDFPRVRVGIGMPEFKGDLVNYVIGNITDEDYEELKKGINKASEAVVSIIKDGIDMAMNKYNK